jgi:hypothetical protein
MASSGCLVTRLTTPPPPPRPKIIALGPAQHLDPLQIVERAVILDVVAQPVDEEVGGGVIAAQRDLVAMPLALADRDAGQIAQHFDRSSASPGRRFAVRSRR